MLDCFWDIKVYVGRSKEEKRGEIRKANKRIANFLGKLSNFLSYFFLHILNIVIV